MAKEISHLAHRVPLQKIWVSAFLPECDHLIYGSTFYELYAQISPNDIVLSKSHDKYSVYSENKETFEKLRKQGIQGFVVTGLYSNLCILHSVRGLIEQGFSVIVITDLITSLPLSSEIVTDDLNTMRKYGAGFITKEAFSTQLLQPKKHWFSWLC